MSVESKLFQPIRLRGVELSNRVVVAPMCQYQADDGSARDWHLMNLGQYAVGAAALVFTEATHVSAEGRITPRCLGLYSDDNEQALARVVGFCREFGVAKLGIQLAHAGRKASTSPPLQGGRPLPAGEGAWQTVSSAAVPHAADWHVPQALDEAGMARVRDEFVAAAVRAARLGFDVCELHCAHGYLMHQFLSPVANQRNDGWGGDLVGRMRFPLEVFEAVRAVWPDDLALGVRVSAVDWVDGGTTVEDTVAFARQLADRGCDFVDVSSGGVHPDQKIPLGPGYQVHLAAAVREGAGLPVMAVGMITDAHHAERIVADGEADMVALARGMMFNPRWAWHAAEALGAETAYAPQFQRCRPTAWPQAFAGRRAAG